MLLALLFSISFVYAQGQQNSPAVLLAQHIANKMADSLALTAQQKTKVLQINMDLHKEKDAARKRTSDRTIVGAEIQRIEKSRDTLYSTVLNEQQYLLYKSKKRNLITAR